MDAEKQKDTLHKPQIEWKNISVFNFLKKKKTRKHAFIRKGERKKKEKKKGKEKPDRMACPQPNKIYRRGPI